MTAAQKG